MLINAHNLKGAAIIARDGAIGAIDDFYFDDEKWTVRYLVVDTGAWLFRRDVLISPVADSIENLPQGAVVGTASLRRQAQLLALRPDLKVQPLRGNVGTRLDKLARGEAAAAAPPDR